MTVGERPDCPAELEHRRIWRQVLIRSRRARGRVRRYADWSMAAMTRKNETTTALRNGALVSTTSIEPP